MRVQHRHIIYVQGYDPRGLAQYYRMFRTELRKFGRLYQLTTTVSRPKTADDGEIASWTIETKAGDWQTRTGYDFLRFEDLIQRDLAAPIWRTVFRAIWIYWRLVFRGTIARFWKAHWRFATFITYPHLMLLVEALLQLRRGLCDRKGTGRARRSRPVQPLPAAVIVFVALLGTVLKYTENADLPALSAVRHDLDLAILPSPAAGMGRADRPFRPVPDETSPARATPRKSSSSATARDRFWAPRSWRAR